MAAPTTLPPPLPARLDGTNRAYVPFVVLSRPRSGTSMLVRALRGHPRAIAFGEVYNQRHIGFNTPGFDNADRRLRAWRDRYPSEFMRRAIFRPYSAQIESVGFKLFYRHLAASRCAGLAEELAGYEGLRVLRLNRENLLHVYTSGVIAARTGVWGIRTASERRTVRVRLSPLKCQRFFEESEREGTSYSTLTERRESLDVDFERLAADLSGELDRVQRFLELKPRTLEPITIRQQTRPYSEVIRNYAALQGHFRSTRWGRFFDE